ncbi:MAG: DsrE/DsrF/DrsH-like family protein [Candidatus Bipolaricaulia bacterium]
MKLFIVLLSNDPKRVYPALTFAMGAAAMGNEAHIYSTMDGLDLVHPERRNAIRLEGMPPIDRYFKDALGQGVHVCACAPSFQMLEALGITEEMLDEGVTFEDVTGFLLTLQEAVGPETVVTFI